MLKFLDVDELGKNGFCVIRDAIDHSIIDRFNKEYASQKNLVTEPFLSYLHSREDYLNNEIILNFINTGILDKYAIDRNEKYSVHLAEARIGSSNINWHRDFNENLEVDKFTGKVKSGRHYLGMLICVDDFGIHAGAFEAVPTSHTWSIDREVINYKNMMENPSKCYSYYEEKIAEWSLSTEMQPFRFFGKKGDAIFWYGSTIHRGAQANSTSSADMQKRDSLILHLSSVGEDDLNKSFICEEKDRKYLPVNGTSNIFQTIHDNS